MMPLTFGPADRPLHGVYDPASQPRLRKGGLLLNPWGWEAIRSHRSFRSLAQRLATAGVDVLRFDYSGSGDSHGAQEDVSVEAWLEDAEHALDELLATADLRRAVILGLRLGGLLAAEVAVRRPRDVERVVLWEPPRSGRDFVADVDRAKDMQANAFPLPTRFREEILRLELDGLADFPGEVVLISTDVDTLDRLSAFGAASLSPREDEPACWLQDRNYGAGAVPTALIGQLVDRLRS